MTEEASPTKEAPKACVLCDREDLPIEDESDREASVYGVGYATGLRGFVPDLCDRHMRIVGASTINLDAAMASVAATGRIAQVMGALANATGLSVRELNEVMRRHASEGLGPLDSFGYFQKVAAARGCKLEFGLVGVPFGQGPTS